MRFFCNINANPRALVVGLGSNIELSRAEVKRRDAGSVELQLFTGDQGGAVPVKLAEAFEMRFAAKAKNDWDGEAVVLEQSFAWRPVDQVYVASPNFNTTQLNELFAVESGEEPDEVPLMAEFTWRDLAVPAKWTSTVTFDLVVKNDVIRGDEGAPVDTGEPTIYVTQDELAVGFVKTTAAQSLTDEQKAQARANIGVGDSADVVKHSAQTLTTEQKDQARENIGAASAAGLVATDAAVADLEEVVDGKASISSVGAVSANVAALSAAAVKTTAQVLSAELQAQARANIGAAAADSARPITRLPVLFNPVGNSTTIHTSGALNGVTGTATRRDVQMVATGRTVTAVSGTTLTSAGHTGVNDQPVQFSATLFPSPLNAVDWYYLRDVTTDTFAVALTPGGAAISLSGSFTTLKVLLSVAPALRQRRIGFVSSSAAGSSAGTRHSALQWAVSDDLALGRWTFVSRFLVSDAAAVANARLFVGLVGRSTVLSNANPSTNVNLIGVGADSGDATLSVMHNDGSGVATKVDLGVDFPCDTRNVDPFQVVLICNADRTVTYKVTNLRTGITAQANVATDLPMALQLLAPQHWRNNGSTALAVGLDVMEWRLEAGA